MNGAGRKSLSWTTHLGVMVGFLVLTVLFLYPASFQFTTRIVGAHNDAFENLWNFWWIHHVLTGPPTSFFVTDYLFHPHGVILHLHSLSLANAAAAAVLQGLVSLSTAYNLIAMASFALSGWAMFWLAYDRAGSVPASFLAGFVYTFSPYHLAHGLGHINLMGLQWLPLYVLFLMRTRRRSRLTEPVLAALFLILTALTSWYYFVFALVLTFLYGAWETYRTPGDVLGGWALGRWLLTLLLAAAVLLPLLVPMMAVSSSHSFYGQHVSETWSVDAASLLCPGRLTSLGRVFSPSDCWNPFPRSIEGGTYLGVTVLLLALYGSTRHEEGTFWGLVGAGALVLALGPVLHLLGRVYSVPLPFAWLERWMPFASVMAMPVRWMAVVFFALSLLVAHASVDLFFRVDELRWRGIRVGSVSVDVGGGPGFLPHDPQRSRHLCRAGCHPSSAPNVLCDGPRETDRGGLHLTDSRLRFPNLEPKPNFPGPHVSGGSSASGRP